MSETLDQYTDSDFTGKTLIIKQVKDEIRKKENKAYAITTDNDNRTKLLKEVRELRALLPTLVADADKIRGKSAKRSRNTYIERAMKLTIGNRFK